VKCFSQALKEHGATIIRAKNGLGGGGMYSRSIGKWSLGCAGGSKRRERVCNKIWCRNAVAQTVTLQVKCVSENYYF